MRTSAEFDGFQTAIMSQAMRYAMLGDGEGVTSGCGQDEEGYVPFEMVDGCPVPRKFMRTRRDRRIVRSVLKELHGRRRGRKDRNEGPASDECTTAPVTDVAEVPCSPVEPDERGDSGEAAGSGTPASARLEVTGTEVSGPERTTVPEGDAQASRDGDIPDRTPSVPREDAAEESGVEELPAAWTALAGSLTEVFALSGLVESLRRKNEDLERRLHDQGAALAEAERATGLLEAKLRDCELTLAQVRDERDRDREELHRTRQQLERLRLKSAPPAPAPEGNRRASGQDDGLRRMVSTWAESSNFQVRSLTEALETVAGLWPERVEILPSAWESAAVSSDFRDPTKAFRLLVRLVTGYWEDMAGGGGDSRAKKRFSQTEAAWDESQGVDRAMRTFGGRVMVRHLKIGVGRGTSNGWRCHFDYDAATRRIVIGWCGKHLDHRG